MESSIKKSFDSTDVVSKHTTISTLHQSVVDKHLSLHDSLKDDGEINVNLSIIEYLSKKANKAQDNADSHAVKTHLPNGIRVVDLNTVADLTNFPQEIMKIVHHHGIPKHLYFRLVLHLVETAKKHKDAHSSVLAAVANLNKINGELSVEDLQKKSILECVNDCGFAIQVATPLPWTLKRALDTVAKTGTLVNNFAKFEDDITDYQKELDSQVQRFNLDASDTVKLVVYQLKTAWAFGKMRKARAQSFSHSCHKDKLTHKSVCTEEGHAAALQLVRNLLVEVDESDIERKRTADDELVNPPPTHKPEGPHAEPVKTKDKGKGWENKKFFCRKCKKTKDQLYHANVLNDKGEEVACPHEPKGNGYKFAKARWAKEAGE